MNRRLSALTVALILISLPWAGAQAPQGLELTMKQAIEMALENNLDIVVSRLSTQVQEEGVGVAHGAFKPLFSADLTNFTSRTPAATQLIGARALEQSRATYNFTWQQQLPFGMSYNVAFENRRSTTNSAFTEFNPLFDSVLTAQVTQPLLKNLNLNPGKQQVVVAQNGERVARHQFEARVMDIVRDVQVAYWDLVQSIRELEVANKSLELAEDLLHNNQVQVEVGTMAPIDVLEAEAEVATRREAVILAGQAIRNNEDQLKRLINDPDAEDFWTMSIKPVDQPTETEVQIDVDESVRIALERRPELAQSRASLDTSSYNVRYTRNQLRPQVDLVGSLAFTGLGGRQFIRQGFAGTVLEEIPGGYSDALDQLFGGDFRDWTLGLRVSYPIGHSTEAAQHAQAQMSYRQQRASIESQELAIAQEVRAAVRAVETNRQRIETTRVARELAQERLEAEEKKFEVGMSTSFFIVQAQRDLTQAAANEVIAVIDYNKALVAFERARGTLLDRDNVTVK